MGHDYGLCGVLILALMSIGCGREAAPGGAASGEAADGVEVLDDVSLGTPEPEPVDLTPIPAGTAGGSLHDTLDPGDPAQQTLDNLRGLTGDDLVGGFLSLDQEERARVIAWILKKRGSADGQAGFVDGQAYPAAWLAPDEFLVRPVKP